MDENTSIENIYFIRSTRVMLDRDLAVLYNVETRALTQAVRRNLNRFPKDFMFQLNPEEHKNLTSQSVTSSWGGHRKPPMAFTEQGIAMLSSVLRSEIAVQVNIEIIRVFTKLRKALINRKDVLIKLEKLESLANENTYTLGQHKHEIQKIFVVLKQLVDPDQPPRKLIGFKQNG